MPGRVFAPNVRLLRRLRAAVRDDLLRAGVPGDVVDDAVFCVHEACMNSIQHGAGQHSIHWEVRDDEIAFEVCDEGDGPSLAGSDRPPATDQLRGRGLFLIGALARRLETRSSGARRCLAFAFPLQPGHQAGPERSGPSGGEPTQTTTTLVPGRRRPIGSAVFASAAHTGPD